MTRYSTIVADPPWAYNAPASYGCTLEHRPNRDVTLNKLGAGSRARYGAMALEDIAALPVADVAEPNAHLYLWTTNAFMAEAYPIARAWGFKPATIITWTKVKPDGSPSMKMGWYYRGATEHCLFCVRGKLRLKGEAHPTAILAPRTPHSAKPPYFYGMVEEQSPGPYLEMFAREGRLGWDSWGDQAPGGLSALEQSAEEADDRDARPA
jgi:N6-adenosine-specific RNA methylase IME4